MTYYEEFGVLQTATTEEIRHAYKALARIMHPDHFSDEEAKRLGELQMKRLNQMLSVLMNPEARARYDLLQGAPPAVSRRAHDSVFNRPKAVPVRRPVAAAVCAWAIPLVGAVSLFGVFVYYGSAGWDSVVATTSARSARRFAAVSPELSAKQTAPLIQQSSATVEDHPGGRAFRFAPGEHTAHQIDGLLPSVAQSLAGAPMLQEPPPLATGAVLPEVLVPRPTVREPEVLQHSTPSAARFAGNWYYVPTPETGRYKGVYLPEFVELRLAEENGTLRGRYHARYRVTDQAISPEVSFQFSGAGTAPVAELAWIGPGDSRGEVTLHLLTANQIEVTWTASQLSANLNLASGAAQLTRQREQ